MFKKYIQYKMDPNNYISYIDSGGELCYFFDDIDESNSNFYYDSNGELCYYCD